MESTGRTVIPWGTAKVHTLDETVQQAGNSLVNAIVMALSVHRDGVTSGTHELHIACEGTASPGDIAEAEQYCLSQQLHLRSIGAGNQRVFIIEA